MRFPKKKGILRAVFRKSAKKKSDAVDDKCKYVVIVNRDPEIPVNPTLKIAHFLIKGLDLPSKLGNAKKVRPRSCTPNTHSGDPSR